MRRFSSFIQQMFILRLSGPDAVLDIEYKKKNPK